MGWIKADTKAIQAIGKHVISNNQRITVSHDPTRSKFRLHITGVTLEDAGPYMCQINSLPVKAQVSEYHTDLGSIIGIFTMYITQGENLAIFWHSDFT